MEKALSLLEEHTMSSELKVHWNLPCIPLLEHSSLRAKALLTRLKNRIDTKGDLLLPMGYSGAHHPFLLKEELRYELDWTFVNRWNSGWFEFLSSNSAALMPPSMDFCRESSKQLYREKNYLWLAISSGERNRIYLIRGEKLLVLPFIDFSKLSVKEISKALKSSFKKIDTPLVLLFNLFNNNNTFKTNNFLDSLLYLKRRYNISFCKIPQYFQDEAELNIYSFSYSENGDIPLESVLTSKELSDSPVDRVYRIEACKIRENRDYLNKPELLKKILIINSPQYLRSKYANGNFTLQTPPIKGRSFIANMSGTVNLGEADMEAVIFEGKLKNFSVRGKEVLIDECSSSYISYPKRQFSFEQSGIFSFEDEMSRGLREISGIDLPDSRSPGKLMIDYYLLNEFPALFISVFITYPELRSVQTIQSYSPLEIPLFRITPGHTVMLEALFPDGEKYSQKLPAISGYYRFPGKTFILTCGESNLLVDFTDYECRRVNLLPVRIRKIKKDYLLYINPGGSYCSCPSTLIEGVEEHFTLMLIAGINERLSPPPIPASVVKELSPAWIGRYSAPVKKKFI